MATVRAPSGIEKSDNWVFDLTMPIFVVNGSAFNGIFLAHADKDVLAVWGKFVVGDLVREIIHSYIVELDGIFDLKCEEKEKEKIR